MASALPLISLDSNIRFGKPCITGTRIAVQDISSWLASGMTNEDIVADFLELTVARIEAVRAGNLNLTFSH